MYKQVNKIKIRGGRDANRAIMRKMVVSMFDHGHMEVTSKRARLVKAFVDRIITKARVGDKNAYNFVFSKLNNKEISEKVVKVIVPAVGDRKSGFLKMTRVGTRLGDGADMVRLAFVDAIVAEKKEVEKSKSPKVEKIEAPKVEKKKVVKKVEEPKVEEVVVEEAEVVETK